MTKIRGLVKECPILAQKKLTYSVELFSSLWNRPFLRLCIFPCRLPLPEALFKGIFGSLHKLLSCIGVVIFCTLKSHSLEWHFEFGKEPIDIWTHVWELGRLLNLFRAVFHQLIPAKLQCIDWTLSWWIFQSLNYGLLCWIVSQRW